MTDEIWEKLKPQLKTVTKGKKANENRAFIEAVLLMLRTGARWQDIPPEYGNTTNILRRFYRWRDNGVWVAILEVLLEHPEYDWLTNSESPRYSGSLAGQLWPWMRLFKENDLLKQAHLPPKLAQQLTAR